MNQNLRSHHIMGHEFGMKKILQGFEYDGTKHENDNFIFKEINATCSFHAQKCMYVCVCIAK